MKNMVKTLKTKLSTSKGFTLVELLFSIIILMLSTSIIIQCFSLGIGSVIEETRASEAQLLCSALTSSLQNELTYAQNIQVDATSGNITYFSSSRRMGEGSQILIENGEAIIRNGTDPDYPLVASSNYTATNRAGVNGSGYFLKAYPEGSGAITYANGVFKVRIWVDKPGFNSSNPQNDALAYSEFSVKPLSGKK